MFAPAHLRVPHRDRAILGGSLVAIAAPPGWRCGCGRARRMGTSCTTTGRRRAAAARGRGVHRRLDADDRRDDAAEQRAAGRHLRRARRRRPRPRRLVALLLPGYLLVWAASGSPAGSPTAAIHAAVDALPWLAEHPEADHRCDPACRRPVAVQPVARPLPRRMPEPARVRHEPLARRRPSGARRSRWASPTGPSASAAAGR